MRATTMALKGPTALFLLLLLLTCSQCTGGSPAPSFYIVTSTVSIPGPGDPPGMSTLTTAAVCQPGDQVVGGGIAHAVMGPNSNIDQITSAPNAAGTGWVGLIGRIMGAGTTLDVSAVCADLTP